MEEAEQMPELQKCKMCSGLSGKHQYSGFHRRSKRMAILRGLIKVISESSALPAICGRVCPQESQCEGKCIRGIKGEAVSIGKLERFVADWARENGIKPAATSRKEW